MLRWRQASAHKISWLLRRPRDKKPLPTVSDILNGTLRQPLPPSLQIKDGKWRVFSLRATSSLIFFGGGG